MIRGIHYFSAEVKPKLMSSQGAALSRHTFFYLIKYKYVKGVVNCQKSRDKGPPEGNSVRGQAKALFHNNTKYAFHTQSLIKSKFSNHSKFIYT